MQILILAMAALVLSSCSSDGEDVVGNAVGAAIDSIGSDIHDALTADNFGKNPKYPCQGVNLGYDDRCKKIVDDTVSGLTLNGNKIDTAINQLDILTYYGAMAYSIEWGIKNDSCKRIANISKYGKMNQVPNEVVSNVRYWSYVAYPIVYVHEGNVLTPARCYDDQEIRIDYTLISERYYPDAVDSLNGFESQYLISISWDAYHNYAAGNIRFNLKSNIFWIAEINEY